MKNAYLLIITTLFSTMAFAQSHPLSNIKPKTSVFYHANYDWDTVVKLVTLAPDEDSANAVILLDNRVMEYAKNPDGGEDDFDMYITRHKRIRVNNDKGVDEYNKVFVPIREDDDVITLKARSIAKDGTVKELNEESIRNLENYEDYGSFALFAIEGVEKGGEIEYIYTIKREAEIFGRETFQTDAEVKKAMFTLITVDELKFGTYGYNGFPSGEFVKEGERYRLSVTVNDIEALFEEDYSGYGASQQKIAYKLDGRKGEDARLNTWNDASMRYMSSVYSFPTQFDPEKFMKSIKIHKLKTVEEKLLALEDYLKSNVAIKLESGAGLNDPAQIISRKYGNEMGLTRLYGLCLLNLGIKHQLVVSCSRYDNEFVAEFEDYYNLDEFLIYIPELKKYISPGNVHLRLGVPPSYLTGNNGLFITVPYGLGQVREIPAMDYQENTIKLDAEVVFDKSMENVTVKKKQSWTGHTAYSYRLSFEYADDESKEEFIKELMASGLDDAVIKSKTTVNANVIDNASKKPLELSGEYTSSELIENAGSTYILNVGDIIGPQSELYQEHVRQTDIDFPYPKQYIHHIYFTIPEGYVVKGLEDVKISKELKDKGEVAASFNSTYTVTDNVVQIDILEFYATSSIDKKQYEGFRSVINAASDFNKVVLVLEPKK